MSSDGEGGGESWVSDGESRVSDGESGEGVVLVVGLA